LFGINRSQYHGIVFKMTIKIFSNAAFIINPILLPFAGSNIIGVIAFAYITSLCARPLFQHDATVKYQTNFAITCFFIGGCKCFPLSNPEIKLPVNRIARTRMLDNLLLRKARCHKKDQ
jgi:hypothetical protein